MLIEVGDLQGNPVLHPSLLGFEIPQEEVQEGRLPAPVGPDNADLVSPKNGGGEVFHDGRTTMAEIQMFSHEDLGP
jgi:hypothetical protein